MDKLKIKFDKLTSHDITFVGIIQTARASGLEKFPIPYVLTNCHNSLCAVGGTINEDDHLFGLTCAKKYGGVYVPPHQAVIHQFAREMLAGGGRMILGSDSHTRYGALGTMAMGEGGPELVKQLLNQTYDINMPGVVAVYLKGAPVKGVGPQDVALAIIGAVFANGYVKNKVMEFVGPGVASLSADFRIGIDVMTTETTCLSSIWKTDDRIKEFYDIHGRSEDYKELNPGEVAYYDGMIKIDLSTIRPMIAMPFHPSNTYTIEELNANLMDILDEIQSMAEPYRDYESWFLHIEEYGKELEEQRKQQVEFRKDQDAVTLSTMHSAKGLEYQVVFILQANEGITPYKKAVKPDEIEEERRMFYVAVTRAKTYLHIYVLKERYNKPLSPSRFVNEIRFDRSKLAVGETVRHRSFGEGTITYLDRKKIGIYFQKSGETRILSLEFVLEQGLLSC